MCVRGIPVYGRNHHTNRSRDAQLYPGGGTLNREITRAGVEKREEMVVAYTETPANDENRHKAKAEEEEEEEVRNNNEKMGETVGSRRQQQSSWATTSSSRLYKLKLNLSP
jgi:hypothetical protein